jgi:hypothetical protein
MSFFVSLKQRKIFQWAVAYLAGAWVLMQLIDVLGERWGVSDATARIVDIILIVGFFVTLVVAWYHGDQGRQRVSGPELLIIAALLAVGGLVLGILNFDKEEEFSRTEAGAGRPVISDEKPWIAVLPFKVQTADPELDAFAAGLAQRPGSPRNWWMRKTVRRSGWRLLTVNSQMKGCWPFRTS